KVFFFWGAIYAAFFMTPVMTGVHVTAMIGGYAGVLIALGDKATHASLQWALTASALVLVAVAIQALNTNVKRLIDRLTQSGRFALLLPYTDEHGAYLLAERLRTGLAELPAIDGDPIRMSFGVAGFPRHGAGADVVFHAAETALAEAQEAGGGRVMLFQRTASSARVEITMPGALVG